MQILAPCTVSPVTTTSHSRQGCPLVYTTTGTCCFPWHQRSLEKRDQRADSTRNATKFLHGIQPRNSRVWQPVRPFLTLFSLGSAAPAPGTQVPTAIRGEGPGTREPRSQRRMKDNVGLCRNPEARRWLRVNVRFWVGSGESCPALPSITLLWLHVQNGRDAGQHRLHAAVHYQHHTRPGPSSQMRLLKGDGKSDTEECFALSAVGASGSPTPPDTSWQSTHTGAAPASTQGEDRAVFSSRSPSSPRRRGCLNPARAC